MKTMKPGDLIKYVSEHPRIESPSYGIVMSVKPKTGEQDFDGVEVKWLDGNSSNWYIDKRNLITVHNKGEEQ